MPIRLNVFSTPYDAAAPVGSAAASLPWSEISTDWYGRKLAQPFRYRLDYHPAGKGSMAVIVVRYEIAIPPQPRADTVSGAFVTGLWNFDAAEIFFADAAGVPYMEFNLSPYGEWWACRFSSFRLGKLEITGAKAVPAAAIKGSGWSGSLAIPEIALEARGIDPKGMVAHVAAVVGPGAERRYISSKPLSKETPDFHRPETFDVLERVPVKIAAKK